MEDDGKTRVFIRGGKAEAPTAWLIYPDRVPYEERLQGSEAEAVIERQDALCVNSELFEAPEDDQSGFGEQIVKNWAVFVNGAQVFDIDRMDTAREDDYPVLVETLERHLGRTGLTIIAS